MEINYKPEKRIKLGTFLKDKFPILTNSILKTAIKKSFIKVNKKNQTLKESISQNDLIEINIENIRDLILQRNVLKLHPTEMEINIIFENEDIFIIDKPEGIAVHPSFGHESDTLLNGLISYVLYKSSNPFVEIRPLNRLDKDTSGIVLFSKNLHAHEFYSQQFKKGKIEKTYLAIVNGNFEHYLRSKNKPKITIISHISKKPLNRKYRNVEYGGEYAETEIYFEKHLNNKKYSLLKVIPKTGRTHQIRVHLSELGFPIVGDNIYQGIPYNRLLLHSWKLRLKLYNNSEVKEFSSELFLDLIKYLL